MTIEEITRTLQTVADNQVQTTQLQAELEATVQEIAQFHQQVLRDHEARQARLDEAFKTLIELASATDGRLDHLEESLVHTDARLDALIDNQVQTTQRQAELEATVQEIAQFHQQVLRDHEARQARLDEAFKTLIELASATDGRLDHLEESQVHTDARLDALIDAQIQLTQHFDQMTQKVETLTSDIAAFNGRFNQMAEHVDRVTENVDRLTADIAAINGRVDRIDERLDRMSERVEAHDRQFVQIGERLDQTGKRLDKVATLQAENAEQMKRTDSQIRALVAAQAARGTKQKAKVGKRAKQPSKKKQ